MLQACGDVEHGIFFDFVDFVAENDASAPTKNELFMLDFIGV